MSEVDQKPLSWLWSGRVPFGKVTILEGDPGLGKSTIWCDIVARVTTGHPFPGESEARAPQQALIVAAEDDLGDTIVPRLRAAGADVSRVATIPLSRGDDGHLIPLALPDDLNRIKEMLVEHRIKLLVIDPVMAFLSEAINSHNDASVRRALTPLAELLQDTGAACLLIRHLNKSGEMAAIYRGGGSIAFTGAARSGLLVAPHPEDEDVRVLAQVKTNLSRKVPSLTYQVAKRSDDENMADTFIEWGEEVDADADGLLGKKDGRRDTSVRDNAATWLRDFLADGPQEANTVKREGDQAGHAWRTLQRVKLDMSVDSLRGRDENGKTQGWLWSMGPAVEVESAEKPRKGRKKS